MRWDCSKVDRWKRGAHLVQREVEMRPRPRRLREGLEVRRSVRGRADGEVEACSGGRWEGRLSALGVGVDGKGDEDGALREGEAGRALREEQQLGLGAGAEQRGGRAQH